jgi:hypothetical protein
VPQSIHRLGYRGSISGQRQEIYLFSTASIPDLGPTHPPVQWVPSVVSRGLERQGREADHSPRSSAIPPLSSMSSWCSARLSMRIILPFVFSHTRNVLVCEDVL